MSRLARVIHTQGNFLLENYWHAMLCAVVLALLPYTAWLASALIALVTLRKGWRNGGVILLAVMVAYLAFSVRGMTFSSAALNSVLTFMPCFIGACVLAITASWRMVAVVFLTLVALLALLVQMGWPDLILTQFLMFKSVVNDFQADSNLLQLVNQATGLRQLTLANYLFGTMIVGLFFSSLLSLMVARLVQSQLYYPDGFRREMYDFRADKIDFVFLSIVIIGAYSSQLLAINLLPMFVFYFLLAGLSLGLNLLLKRKPLGAFLLLFTPLLFVPYVMLPIYLLFGTLDSLFNFRLYLPNQAGKYNRG